MDFLTDERNYPALENEAHRNGRSNSQESSTEQKIHTQIESSLDKYIKKYQCFANQLLPSSGHSIDSDELIEQHESTLCELKQLFATDLEALVEHYMSILKTKVDIELKKVLQINEKRALEEVRRMKERLLKNQGILNTINSLPAPCPDNPLQNKNVDNENKVQSKGQPCFSSPPSAEMSPAGESGNGNIKSKAVNDESRQPSPMPSTQTLRSRREINDIVIPKISALLQNYKTAMNQASDIDAAHLVNSRKAINDFRHVLSDIQIEGNQKEQLVRQLENKLNLEYRMLKNVVSKIVARNNTLCNDINECEIQAADRLIQTIKPYYRDNMDAMTKDKFFMPEMLRRLHDLIVQETIDAFWKTCDFKVNQEIPADITSQLVQCCEDQFKHFVTKNNVKAEKARLEAKKLLIEHRKMYNSGMDTILSSRGPSRDQNKLEKEHNQIMKETCKLFEMEMSNMEVKISYKEEASILKNNIMQDWEELKKLNVKLQENERAAERKKREQEEREQREIEKESKKKEAELTARNLEVEADGKKREKQKITKQHEKNKPRSSSNLSSISTTSVATELNKLPTIAIEFGYTRARVGLMVADQFAMIKDMPAQIAVDRDGVLIGEAANVHSDKFALCGAFTGISMNQQHSCFINGVYQKVRMEVLVALFFAKLKADVEEQLSGQWTRAVITVPLGFTSVQRQLMKDAAFMARFEATQIMNDTTAAAICFSQTKDYSRESLLLVGVDHNHGLNFDAALYDWSNFGKSDYELCMEASCGNLHSSAIQDNGLMATFTNVKEFCTETVYRQWWCGKKEIDGVRKMIKNMISTKDVTANACISYGSTSGNEAFRDVINKHGRPAVNAELFIVQGAAMVSQNLPIECDWPTKMSFKDKAAYVFQRTSTSHYNKSDVILSEKQQSLTSVSCNVDSTLGVINSLDYQIMIRGSSQGNQQHQIGCLVVKSACIYDDICRKFGYPPEVKVRFLLSNEGILSFENAFVVSGGSSGEVIPSEWMSPNIDRSKREEFRAQVASIINDKKKMAFKKSKAELKALIAELQPLIGDVKKPIGKRMLEEGVESAEKMLAHPKTTHEQVEKKIEYLNGLTCKYVLK